jgi:hypothetical protein
MSTLAKSGFVLAACAVAAFTWWVGAGAVVPPASAAVAGANESAASPIAANDEKDRGAERAVVASESPDLLALAQPYEFELRARVVDANGLPFGGGHVALAPPACALALSEQMDGEGRVTVKWRARAKQLTMVVGFAFHGKHTSLQQVAVAAGVPADVSFVAGVAPLPVQVTVDAIGRQIVTMPECSQNTKADCRICHETIDGPKLFEVRGAMRTGMHPDAVFGDRLAIAPPEPDAWKIGVTGPWHHGIAPSWQGTSRHRVEGRVFRTDGNPAASVVVQFLRGGTQQGTRTDAQGWYGMPKPPGDGPVIVRAGGGAEGLATHTIEIAGSCTIVPDLMLDTGRTLRGRVCGSDGKNLNGARVEYTAPAGSDGDVATVGPDGAFAFANLPPGAGSLLVWGVTGERFPIAEEPSVLPNSSDVAIDLRQRSPANGELRVFVRGHDGETPQDIEVRCWQQQTKRGSFLERREDGAFHAHGLMAGFYRIEIGTLATGFRDLGVQWIDGTGLVDLGTVQLPQPARLHVETDAVPDVLELYAVRADVDVRADEIVPWTREVLLPAGRWVALWKRDGKVAMREFALEAGAANTLRTDR